MTDDPDRLCAGCAAFVPTNAITRTRERRRVRLVVAWYDLWVGAYWNRSTRTLYLFPVPCVGVAITGRRAHGEPRGGGPRGEGGPTPPKGAARSSLA